MMSGALYRGDAENAEKYGEKSMIDVRRWLVAVLAKAKAATSRRTPKTRRTPKPAANMNDQKSNRNMNSTRRGAPVPVAPSLRMLVILPKLAAGFGELPVKEPRAPDGFLYIG